MGVRTHDEIVVCLLVKLVVLHEVVDRSGVGIIIVTRHGEYRDVDLRVLVLVRLHGLPIRIERWVLHLPVQQGVQRPVDRVDLAIRSPTRVPLLVQRFAQR